MKTLHFILSLICLTSCSDRHDNNAAIQNSLHADTTVKHDTIFVNYENDWQQGFGLTHDPEVDSIWFKPVKFYVDNPKCSPIAIDFYLGQFRPTDNNTTSALLKLATTEDNNLRPFYRWCLNKTIEIQDGALAEYTGVPARLYAEKYPKEFFQYMDFDTSLGKYKDWVGSIAYSGFYDNEDYKKTVLIRQRLTTIMNKNCTNCSIELQQRIDKFAKDCFP